MNRQMIQATQAIAIALLLASAAAAPMAQAQSTDNGNGGIKIGVVDLDFIVAQSPAGKALQSKLEAFQKRIREEGESKAEAARDLRTRIAEGANTLSDDKLAELQRQYEDAQVAIRRFQDDKQREGQKMQQEGLREVEKQLEPVFERIRDSGGYDLILNNVPGVVVMAGERVDITKMVLDELNSAG